MRYDVQRIFFKTPKDRQVMMFSATLSHDIREICKKFMQHPKEVIIDEGKQLRLAGLRQFSMTLREDEKTRKLTDIFDNVDFNQVFVFVKSVQRAKKLNEILQKEGFPTIALYGSMPQKKRDEGIHIAKSDSQSARIMVATDLCGRGVDFKSVNVVINYDMPEDSETYLHRVGRAGRFGTKGIAISFVTPGTPDEEVLAEVKQKFVDDLPNLEDVRQIQPSDYMGHDL
jgi:ATP-dependent RNA helicase UAP56/SUB2